MSIFQKMYDAIKGITTPVWLKILFDDIQSIVVSTFLQIGTEYIKGLENKIYEVQGTTMSNEKKWQVVYTWGKENIPDIKDNALNIAIEVLLAILKKRNFMRVV